MRCLPSPRVTQVSQTLEMPVEARVALELATAEEIDTGMARVIELLHRGCDAPRVEWWAPDEEGELRLRLSHGAGEGERHRFSLGPGGYVVVVGGRRDPRLVSVLASVMPILRRRCVEERLAGAAMKLARRNETLEDFAALVAHELKTPLQAALLADDASSALERALDLVDSLIEAARDSRERPYASAAICLDEVLRDLGAVDAEVTATATVILPLPEVSLRVILRNLLRNAIAAGATHVHVAAVRSSDSWRLVVDDNGVGLAAAEKYRAGSGLGLSLCRRIGDRYGAALELASRPTGGTRATLQPAGAP
jgi:signal transduction histidine kinase